MLANQKLSFSSINPIAYGKMIISKILHDIFEINKLELIKRIMIK